MRRWHGEYFSHPRHIFSSLNSTLTLPQYNNKTGATLRSDCISCEAGKYTNSTGAAFCSTCTKGKYSLELASECTDCAPGKSSNVESASSCTDCIAGKLTSAPAQLTCSNCALGTFTKIGGSVSCTPCPGGHTGNLDLQSCDVCPNGKFSNPGSASCTICSETAGYVSLAGENGATQCTYCGPGHLADKDTNECKECEVGKVRKSCSTAPCSPIRCILLTSSLAPSTSGSTRLVAINNTCTVCSQGTYNFKAGSSSCFTCSPGSVPIASVCTACKKGKYAQFGDTSCSVCFDNGQYSDTDGAAFCKTAPAGHKPNTDRTSLTKCPPGTYSVGGTTECTPCEPGRYSATEGAVGCTLAIVCGPGNYTFVNPTATNDTICRLCPRDTMSKSGALDISGCSQCDVNSGLYAPPGSTACYVCPQYQKYNQDKKKCECLDTFINDDKSSCTCPVGQTLVDGNCTACDDGRFKDHNGTDSCSVCDTEEVEGAFETIFNSPKILASSCACDVGKFLDPLKPTPTTPLGSCQSCSELNYYPKSVDCSTIGLTLSTLPLKPGYWRSSTDSSNIVKCENQLECTDESPTEICMEGSSGPMCEVCVDGYSKGYTGTCEECESAFVSLGFYLLCAILFFVTVYLALLCYLRNKRISIDSLSSEPSSPSRDGKHWSKRLRSKAKILTSFYQIVSKLPTILAVKFPNIYRSFMAVISSFFNLETFQLISIGCVLPSSMYGFYGSFLMTTLTPILLSIALLVATLIQRVKLTPGAAAELTSSRFSMFLGLAYLVFASTSTTSFTTFLCKQYGDDPTWYLIADKSVNCNSETHFFFKLISGLMILIYPIGISLLYAFQLFKHKVAIMDCQGRESNPEIVHISFLWQDYKPEYWWFELFENFRRLCLTGILVWFPPGSTGQYIASIVLAYVCLRVYVKSCPHARADDNGLAEVAQHSIFFTLLAALMIRMKGYLPDAKDHKFGLLLIFVNCIVFLIVALGLLYKPVLGRARKLSPKHVHDAPLKGLDEEVEYSDNAFLEYFKQLAESDEREAGWKTIEDNEWGLGKKKARQWLEETGAVGSWRCANGEGPIDQFRVCFTLETPLDPVFLYLRGIKSFHPLEVGSFVYVIDKGEDWRQVYKAVRLPWPWSQRDFVYTELTRREDNRDVLIASRSSIELNEASGEISKNVGRVRGLMKLAGIRLRPVSLSETEVTFVLDLDLGVLHYAETAFALSYLREIVDLHKKGGERESRLSSMSEPPKPLPLTRRVVSAAKKKGMEIASNPIFNRSGGESGGEDDDKVNMEMGRVVKGKIQGLEHKDAFSI